MRVVDFKDIEPITVSELIHCSNLSYLVYYNDSKSLNYPLEKQYCKLSTKKYGKDFLKKITAEAVDGNAEPLRDLLVKEFFSKISNLPNIENTEVAFKYFTGVDVDIEYGEKSISGDLYLIVKPYICMFFYDN